MIVEDLIFLLGEFPLDAEVFLWNPKDGYYPMTNADMEQGVLYGYANEDSTERMEHDALVIT